MQYKPINMAFNFFYMTLSPSTWFTLEFLCHYSWVPTCTIADSKYLQHHIMVYLFVWCQILPIYNLNSIFLMKMIHCLCLNNHNKPWSRSLRLLSSSSWCIRSWVKWNATTAVRLCVVDDLSDSKQTAELIIQILQTIRLKIPDAATANLSQEYASTSKIFLDRNFFQASIWSLMTSSTIISLLEKSPQFLISFKSIFKCTTLCNTDFKRIPRK